MCWGLIVEVVLFVLKVVEMKLVFWYCILIILILIVGIKMDSILFVMMVFVFFCRIWMVCGDIILGVLYILFWNMVVGFVEVCFIFIC